MAYSRVWKYWQGSRHFHTRHLQERLLTQQFFVRSGKRKKKAILKHSPTAHSSLTFLSLVQPASWHSCNIISFWRALRQQFATLLLSLLAGPEFAESRYRQNHVFKIGERRPCLEIPIRVVCCRCRIVLLQSTSIHEKRSFSIILLDRNSEKLRGIICFVNLIVETVAGQNIFHREREDLEGNVPSKINWNIDTVNSETLFKHTESIPDINWPMYCIGGAFTFFLYYFGKEDFFSISYISSGSCKVRYVVPGSCKTIFGHFVATELLASDYVNDHHRGVKQIVATKTLLFNPALIASLPFQVKVNKILQRSGLFVLFGPAAHRGGFLIRDTT